jgi:hypothetical protein
MTVPDAMMENENEYDQLQLIPSGYSLRCAVAANEGPSQPLYFQ